MAFLHFDEAKQAATAEVRSWLGRTPDVTKALILGDIFGRFRLAFWAETSPPTGPIEQGLRAGCGAWWTGELAHVDRADEFTKDLYENADRQAQADIEEPRLRVLDRHRSRTAWFEDVDQPLWPVPASGPPIVVFYSFKGGLGRSTLLASFAIQRSQAGEGVCVLDFDLESPGVGRLLSSDAEGLTARWGVVDFLLEHWAADAPLADYFHRCDRVAGAGEIVVFPAGNVDEAYADKLARVDMEEAPSSSDSGMAKLLSRVSKELTPSWILIDARTGISEPAGQLLSGIAHLHVLLGTPQDQSWQGLNRVVERLGRERVLADRPQGDVIVVHALVPPGEAGSLARTAFLGRSETEFSQRYYAESNQDEDSLWDVADMDSLDAPHAAVPIDYDARLAGFGDIGEVVEPLSGGQYSVLAERIVGRFVTEVDES